MALPFLQQTMASVITRVDGLEARITRLENPDAASTEQQIAAEQRMQTAYAALRLHFRTLYRILILLLELTDKCRYTIMPSSSQSPALA